MEGFFNGNYLFFFEIIPIARAKNIPPMIKGKAESKKFAIKSSLYEDNT